MVKGFLKL